MNHHDNHAPAPGLVAVRLAGRARDVAALVAALTAAGVEIVTIPSRPYANRHTPGVRVYLTARTPDQPTTPATARRDA
ncbi:hypothetical protein GCM10009789_20330 [Kribbella sancticallisti]|uniref:Uncharacterized protein n=1 Tax=Kribbella sancticallisti TaxID=460087 RepID=A0ABP4NUF4_9ACTN